MVVVFAKEPIADDTLDMESRANLHGRVPGWLMLCGVHARNMLSSENVFHSMQRVYRAIPEGCSMRKAA